MTVLARKISRAKWGEADAPIRADAVTGDLKTINDALSFWRCGSAAEEHVTRAVLAMAASADKPETFDLVWLDEASVRDDGLQLTATPGLTPVVGLPEHHVDVSLLTLEGLCVLAKRVMHAVRGDTGVRRFTAKEVVRVVAAAVKDGSLKREQLKEKMKEAVEKQLATP